MAYSAIPQSRYLILDSEKKVIPPYWSYKYNRIRSVAAEKGGIVTNLDWAIKHKLITLKKFTATFKQI